MIGFEVYYGFLLRSRYVNMFCEIYLEYVNCNIFEGKSVDHTEGLSTHAPPSEALLNEYLQTELKSLEL